MGCHTWFSVPLITDKKTIIKKAVEEINSVDSNGDRYYPLDYVKIMDFAIENDLMDFIGEYAAAGNKYYNGKVYIGIEEYSLLQYNKKNGTNFDCKYDLDEKERELLESYSDEPRISGYPQRVITSYQEMKNFIESGFTDSKGVKHNFYYEKSRYPKFMKGIKTFFNKHSNGIITFG